MINAEKLALMKPAVRLINVARGGIMDGRRWPRPPRPARSAARRSTSTPPAGHQETIPSSRSPTSSPRRTWGPAPKRRRSMSPWTSPSRSRTCCRASRPARRSTPSVAAASRGDPAVSNAGRKDRSLLAELTSSEIDRSGSHVGSEFENLPTVHLTRAVLKGRLEPIVPGKRRLHQRAGPGGSAGHQDHRKPKVITRRIRAC